MLHVTLIGAGNMGFALLRGWMQRGGATDGYTFSVVEPNEALRARAQGAGAQLLDAASPPIDVLVIATKPQLVAQVVQEHREQLAAQGLVISVAAGISLHAIAASLARPTAIIRAMPNTPAAIGAGMLVCCPNASTDESHRQTAQTLLSASGSVAFVQDEGWMDAVTAVSGSGPAYVFHFIEALTAAAVEVGLSEDLALLLAKQTAFGAAKLALESTESPTVLREQVTSPNGTTAAALAVLMAQGSGLPDLMKTAVAAARDRSVALGRS